MKCKILESNMSKFIEEISLGKKQLVGNIYDCFIDGKCVMAYINKQWLSFSKDDVEIIYTDEEKLNMEECKYCKDYTQKIKEMNGKKAWFSLYEHYMEVINDKPDGVILSFKIKYCPMCGRNLGDGK